MLRIHQYYNKCYVKNNINCYEYWEEYLKNVEPNDKQSAIC